MAWKPSKEEKRFVELVAAMSTDCLMGNGTTDRKTYLLNLRAVADCLEKLKEEEDGKG